MRGRVMLAFAALLVGALVWGAGLVQLRVADAARERQVVVQQLLTAMLEQESGLRGFLLTGDEPFLEPYRAGGAAYGAALSRARELIDGGAAADALERTAARARAWRRAA